MSGSADIHRGPRFVPGRDYEWSMFDPAKNVACMEYHRSSFCIPHSPFLAAFRELVESRDHCTLESSCKVACNQIHANRFNLFYHGEDRASFLGASLKLFETITRDAGVSIDMAPFESLFDNGLSLADARKIVVGIDLREKTSESRLKTWLILSKSAHVFPYLQDQVRDFRLNSLCCHDELLIGFDFRLDGRTDLKVYPDFRPPALNTSAKYDSIRRVLNAEALAAANECSWVHMYLSNRKNNIDLQFHPVNPDDFVARFLHQPAAALLHSIYEKSRLLDMVVSTNLFSLSHDVGSQFTLYYMPADPPSEWNMDVEDATCAVKRANTAIAL